MKKLINDPDAVVREALEGMEAAHGDLIRVVHDPKLDRAGRRARCRARSGIISGGGSGHEPMHGGFVGRGMLDAACPGEVFTSPTPDQMLEATKAVDGGAGVLHIVKNYTGDVLNFEMAADLASGRGHRGRSGRHQRRRGGAGQPLHGRPARCRHHRDRGEDLRRGRRGGQVARGGRRALPPGQRPGPQHGHGADGVHHARLGRAELRPARGRDGDRDRHPRRARALPREARARPSEIVDRLATAIVEDLPYESGDKVLAFVNGMGGTPLIELYIVFRELERFLGEPRDHDRAQPDRQLHHLAGDGRLLDHAAQARRRADAAVGRPVRHTGAASGLSEHHRLGGPRLDR